MIQHFSLLPFVIGLAVGIVGIYYAKSEKVEIKKYPSLENAGKLTYKDKNGSCYKYDIREVDCDSNESRIATYPLQ
jgi:hypothetical protein